MHEYIKRTDAIAEINRGDLLVGNNAEWAREIIWRTPYSDVAPVKHGQWIVENGNIVCSICHTGKPTIDGYEMLICDGEKFISMEKTNFCGNCGAKMDGGVKDGTID